jgi:hypothetical protein
MPKSSTYAEVLWANGKKHGPMVRCHQPMTKIIDRWRGAIGRWQKSPTNAEVASALAKFDDPCRAAFGQWQKSSIDA